MDDFGKITGDDGIANHAETGGHLGGKGDFVGIFLGIAIVLMMLMSFMPMMAVVVIVLISRSF